MPTSMPLNTLMPPMKELVEKLQHLGPAAQSASDSLRAFGNAIRRRDLRRARRLARRAAAGKPSAT